MMPNYNEDYKNILLYSLKESSYFDLRELKKVEEELENIGLLEKIKGKEEKEKKIDKISEVLRGKNGEELKTVVKIFEKIECEKCYSHSILYNYDDKKNGLKNIKNNKDINKKEVDYLSSKMEEPSVNEKDDRIEIKFCDVLTDKNNQKKLKYNFFIIIYLEIGIMQINFEAIPELYKETDYLLGRIGRIEDFLKKRIGLNLYNLKTFRIVENFIKDINAGEKKSKYELKEYLDFAYDEFQGKIRLRVNDKGEMPLIHQIREITKSFNNEEDKQKILKIIEEYNGKNEHYVRGITWIGEKMNQTVVFYNRYGETEHTLVHFYSGSQDKRGRENVIRDIAEGNNRLSQKKK